MRDISVANQTALSEARDKGLVPVQFFWITVKDRTTSAPVEVGLWTGDGSVSLNVVSGVTGTEESRTYQGGVNLSIGPLPRVSDLTIQTVDVSFSALADVCQEIVREHDPRLAKVEVHAGWLDTETRLLVDQPEIDFLGEVDGAPIETGAVSKESLITLKVVSDAISMLTRRNPAKRSYEGQKRRSSDEFNLYSNAVKSWRIFWGEREVNNERSSGGGTGLGR